MSIQPLFPLFLQFLRREGIYKTYQFRPQKTVSQALCTGSKMATKTCPFVDFAGCGNLESFDMEDAGKDTCGIRSNPNIKSNRVPCCTTPSSQNPYKGSKKEGTPQLSVVAYPLFLVYFLPLTYRRGLMSSFTGLIIFSGLSIVSNSSLLRIPCSSTKSYTPRPVAIASLAILVEFL